MKFKPLHTHLRIYLSQGFTMLEMAIVVTIIALVMGMVLIFAGDMVSKRQAIDSKLRIDEIVRALDHYKEMNGHLPCPASRTIAQGAAGFGVEVNSGDCTYTVAPAGTTRVETVASSGVWVLTGALPVRDLLLTDDITQDGYGSRYTYVVMQAVTENFGGTGALIVKDRAGNDIITDGAYVVFSNGKDAKGAYHYATGILRVACDATNLDKENCDNDATFVDAPYNNGTVAANFFDDFIRWKSKSSY